MISRLKPGHMLIALLSIFLLLALGSCQLPDYLKADASEPSAPVIPELAATASPYSGPAAGEYFNGDSGVSLRLDGAGGFVLSSPAGRTEGSCSGDEDGITLLCGSEQLRGRFSSGALVISGIGGLFLPLEHQNSFTELGISGSSDREYRQEGGTYTLSDYGLELGLSYPDTMSAPENLVPDALVVWDKAEGYVVGRNVSADFLGQPEDFLLRYALGSIKTDFRLLYGQEGSWEGPEILDEGVTGRLASLQGLISAGEKRIFVKCIMYTSTYSDGTVNYICKCFFAPEGDEKSFNTLANSVVNMSAVRRR